MNHEALENTIRQRLASLAPQALELRDDSAQHAGHRGSSGGGHFTLRIVSAQFSGKSRVLRHRLVYQQLQDLMPTQIHALSITAIAPDEQ